jgi:hypothetical protein
MALNPTQQSAVAWIEANRARLSDFNKTIWHFAEPAWREYKSSRAYCELLRAEGFSVEAGSGGMPTAFAATWGSGSPVLGHTRRRARDCIRGRRDTPIRIRHLARRRLPASWRPRPQCSSTGCAAR